MATGENKYGSEHLISSVDVPFLKNPTIRGKNRRHDPDGNFSAPYFADLVGKKITIEMTPVGELPELTFSSNDYAQAIIDLNALSPDNLRASDADGFLSLLNLNSGGQNFIKIVSGDAAPILGFDIFPLPGSIHFAGELASSSATKLQKNAQGTSLIAHDEDLTSSVINRAILGALSRVDRFARELDREVLATHKLLAVALDTDVSLAFKFFRLDHPEIRIPIEASFSDLVTIQNTFNQDIYLFSPEEKIDSCKVTSIQYGFDPPFTTGSSFDIWGAFDGKKVTGISRNKTKHPQVDITDIKGNIINCSGATFQTLFVQTGDTIAITDATNTLPFSHNGEFIVEEVFDEETLSVRPKAVGEPVYTQEEEGPVVLTPTKLNTHLDPGTNFGKLRIPMGQFVPIDHFTFITDIPETSTITTINVRIAGGTKLRNVDPHKLTRTILGNQDLLSEQFLEHVLGLVLRHNATHVDKTISPNWADGSSPNETGSTVNTRLDEIVSDLAAKLPSGADGASRVGSGDSVAAFLLTQGTVKSQLESLEIAILTILSEAAFEPQANTFTETNTFGTGDDDEPDLRFSSAPGERKLINEIAGVGGTIKIRIYSVGADLDAGYFGFELTNNAEWVSGGPGHWEKDTNGQRASNFAITKDGLRFFIREAADNANWFSDEWALKFAILDSSSIDGNLDITGNLIATTEIDGLIQLIIESSDYSGNPKPVIIGNLLGPLTDLAVFGKITALGKILASGGFGDIIGDSLAIGSNSTIENDGDIKGKNIRAGFNIPFFTDSSGQISGDTFLPLIVSTPFQDTHGKTFSDSTIKYWFDVTISGNQAAINDGFNLLGNQSAILIGTIDVDPPPSSIQFDSIHIQFSDDRGTTYEAGGFEGTHTFFTVPANLNDLISELNNDPNFVGTFGAGDKLLATRENNRLVIKSVPIGEQYRIRVRPDAPSQAAIDLGLALGTTAAGHGPIDFQGTGQLVFNFQRAMLSSSYLIHLNISKSGTGLVIYPSSQTTTSMTVEARDLTNTSINFTADTVRIYAAVMGKSDLS